MKYERPTAQRRQLMALMGDTSCPEGYAYVPGEGCLAKAE